MLEREYRTASITSSVLDYEFENGRRYHAYKAGSYPLPNDEVRLTEFPPAVRHNVAWFSRVPHRAQSRCFDPDTILTPWGSGQAELERIDIKHHVIMLLAGGHLHLAPLVGPMTILDIGTGTGIWAMEMADQYPDSLVIGTDLSPVQPKWYETIFHVRSWEATKGITC